MNVVSNTTIISNFSAVDRLDILKDLLSRLYITTEVYGEIQDGLAEGYSFYTGIEAHVYPLNPEGWLHLTSLEGDEELSLFGHMPPALHRGEASCLAIAVHRGMAFLSDDARARTVARQLHVMFSGTLGILVQAVKKELVSLQEAESLLGHMIQAGYHSPYVSLGDLLES